MVRLVLAEGIVRKYGAEHFFAFSAGNLSDWVINPLIHKTALAHGDLPENFRSKNLNEFYIHFLW